MFYQMFRSKQGNPAGFFEGQATPSVLAIVKEKNILTHMSFHFLAVFISSVQYETTENIASLALFQN